MKIILATDGSACSQAALDKLLRLDFPAGSEIKIVSCIYPLVSYSMSALGSFTENLEAVDRAGREQAENAVEKAAEQIKQTAGDNFFLSTEISFGTPESVIVELAERWGANLIVVGSHGYNTLERLLLGSVSSAVVNHAPCSVLVVRGKNY